jgi:hypothetical protein
MTVLARAEALLTANLADANVHLKEEAVRLAMAVKRRSLGLTEPPLPRTGEDKMGYSREEGLNGYTDPIIRAAQCLAEAEGYQWDVVLLDPLVSGKRYLNFAKVVIESYEGEKV